MSAILIVLAAVT